MSVAAPVIAPGAQILVRDAVWRVVQVNRTSNGTASWRVVGVSEIVRDQEAIFLEEYEQRVQVLDPCETRLVLDRSAGHRDSLLYMESLLRDVPPTGSELHIGHKAAMDVMPYQLEPARIALARPRQRILIADAVGLGKTLEAGILLAELIRRGRARRILVATTRAMLTQFQKELWCRFAIPLVRLDSVGLQRVRERIPTNHNPFYHFDKIIISIDTLKQNNAFRTHVEQAHWDVVVIDEAHNVAVRGGQRSQRARIAEVLAERSESLILLSATPHDGKARSFASLMNMLDPTAIANPDDYTKEDIQGLYVRRFKHDVANELARHCPARSTAKVWADASPAEEEAFARLGALNFTRLDQRAHAGMLFKTTLEKALLSSPFACLETVEGRIKRLRARPDADDFATDVEQLEHLAEALRAVGAEDFAKYRVLRRVLESDLRWSPRKKDDRLVIFSERIETLRFLQKQLTADLNLAPEQVSLLHGGAGLSDTEQQGIVESFGKEGSKVRLLLASDMAAEGLNLHYLCHKLVHFDVPWSLMVFQQRNGRIDRYGQERTPYIRYLLTRITQPKIKGDTRILDLLIERDDQANKNIGDPHAMRDAYDIEAQELYTARAIETGLTAEEVRKDLEAEVDPFELMLQQGAESAKPAVRTKEPLSLFASDFDYVRTALDRLVANEKVERKLRGDIIELQIPKDLRRRFERLPAEVLPDDGVIVLTPDRAAMQQAIADARREESAWPVQQYLWSLNPVVGWCNDKGRAAFGRQAAPVVSLIEGLGDDEAVVVVSGLIPNRRSQPLVHRWFAARFRAGAFDRLEDFGEFVERSGLRGRTLHNREAPCALEGLQALVPTAVHEARKAMLVRRRQFEDAVNPVLSEELERLDKLRARHVAQLELAFAQPAQASQLDREQRRVNRLFDQYLTWIQESMTTEPAPFLQVIAVFRSERGYGGAR